VNVLFGGVILIRKFMLSLTLVGLMLLSFTTAQAEDPQEALDLAVEWLADQQLEDGGFSTGFAPGSDLGASADAAIAFASAGRDPAAVSVQDISLMDYLATAVAERDLQDFPGLAAKVALAVTASGGEPGQFGGTDLIALVLDGYDADNGLFGTGTFDSALAILALSAAEVELPVGAVEGLLATRIEDGSYAFTGDTTLGGGDSNTTALVVQALLAAGGDDQQIRPSLDYFQAAQNEDGGWTYQKPSDFGEATDANSTSLVIQALQAAGESLESWGDPIDALVLFQDASGAFGFNAAMPDASLLATVQAIPALAGIDYTDMGTLDLSGASTEVNQELLLLTLGIILCLIVVAVLIGRQRSSTEA
jgi:prenyltransferase beta subunit